MNSTIFSLFSFFFEYSLRLFTSLFVCFTFFPLFFISGLVSSNKSENTERWNQIYKSGKNCYLAIKLGTVRLPGTNFFLFCVHQTVVANYYTTFFFWKLNWLINALACSFGFASVDGTESRRQANGTWTVRKDWR